MIVKAYFMAHYRGPQGDDATDADKRINIATAVQVAHAIKAKFPRNLDLFIPHENQDLIHYMWKAGIITSDHILEACCAMAIGCDFGICYGSISVGMRLEAEAMHAAGLEVVMVDEFGEQKAEEIAGMISQIQNKE